MKLRSNVKFTIATLSMLSIYESAFQLISADIMVQFVFNNGESPSSKTFCSKFDIEKIDTIFNIIYRRNLRSTTTYENQMTTKLETMPRELRTVPKKCKNICAKYAPGTCRSTNCLGYRRSLKANKQSLIDHDRTCNEGLTSIIKQLDELTSGNSVSDTCKLYLSSNARNATCYDDVVHGEVEGYRIWNTTSSNGKISPNVLFQSYDMTTGSGGYSFCKTTVFNIEVITNECVDNANLIVRGPNKYYSNRREGFIPFTIFNSSPSDNTDITKGKVILIGQKVPRIGTYNVTIVPDGISTKTKQFDFTILDC